MIDVIHQLKLFFEDCYRRINVREYSRLMGVSPPTASKILFNFEKEGILKRENDRNYILYYANKDSKDFLEFSRIYWRKKLNELIGLFSKNLMSPTIILFGSLSKAEAKADSDIDIAIIGVKKKFNLENFERKLKRKIQIFWIDEIKTSKNEELLNNILNGYVMEGKLRL
ncbi:MAG: nucleotidyltransferase domain-containing protein [Nanoarchaeota archaeon]|nr:nucleotidyltransferase domain-containing protein [Nanoarchaeota archaeon]